MSVGELKQMLGDRGVDYRDCLEKADLVQRLKEALDQGLKVVDDMASAETLPDAERKMVKTFQRCSPSVAFINTLIKVQETPLSMKAMEVPAGQGTGFVWDEHGHVVTNYHVVFPPQLKSKDPTVKVTLRSARAAYDARVVGVEPEKDIAVLKLSAPRNELHPVAVGSSAHLLVGQTVLAIGNPFGLDYTLTTGVVSALNREVMGVGGRPIKGCVQTDAAINPGNSGGPLLDSSGRLIGVNTMIYSHTGSSSGIGFAIPVDTVRRVVNQIIRFGRTIRPSLGVQVADDQVTRALAQRLGVPIEGVMIMEIIPGSPADTIGLQGTRRSRDGGLVMGDVIHKVNDIQIKQVEDLLSAIEEQEIGGTVEITVTRGMTGRTEKIPVALANRDNFNFNR